MRRVGVGLALTLGTLVAPLQGQNTVVVGIGGELSAPRYEHLRVPVFVDMSGAGTEKLGSYTLRVSWNPRILGYRGWTAGSFAGPVVRTDSVYSGVFWASAITASGVGGVADLLSLELSADSVDVDTVRVQAAELSAARTLTDLLATSTLVYRPAGFCPALGRWGDIDADTHANSRDALAVLANLVGLPVGAGFNVALGDVDGDGKVNSRDALILLSYAVGIDIPGQRVLLIAGGACTSGGVPQLVVVPDTADLVVGQSVDLKAFGRDASGRLTALNHLTWLVADPRIGVVDSAGNVIARQPGSTVVSAAVGPGAQVKATLVVRARRPVWYVDAPRAKRAPVQLGTQKWPFATPQYTFPLLAEGDTVRVAPGVHDYETAGCYSECITIASQLNVGAVFIGDTLADGTRPVLRAPEPDYQTAFPWYGGVRGEVRDLVLRGFSYGAYLSGLRSLVLRRVRIEEPHTTAGYGVYSLRLMDTLRVLGSDFVGDTAGFSNYAIYAPYPVRDLEIHGSTMQGWRAAAVYASGGVDTLDVAQSVFQDNGWYGLYVSGNSTSGVVARIAGNRLQRNAGGAIYISSARRAALDHNVITVTTANAVYVTAAAAPVGAAGFASGVAGAAAATAGTKLTLLGDSIRPRASYYYWLYAGGLDSVLVDSLVVQGRADSAMTLYSNIQANYASFTNSKLENLYAEGLDYTGRELVVDNTRFTGCPLCAWTSTFGIRAQPVYSDSGPKLTVTRSSFFNLNRAVDAGASGSRSGPMLLSQNTVDSVVGAFNLMGDGLTISDNTFTRVRDFAVSGQPSYSNRPFVEAQILRNAVTCAVITGYTSYGLRHDNGAARFENNAVRNCRYGLYGYNGSFPLASIVFRGDTVFPDSATYYHVGIRPDGRWQPTIVGNRVVGGYYGIDLTITDSVPTVVDSNAVSATGYAAIDLYFVKGAVTGIRNNVGNNAQYGIYNYYGGLDRSFTLGRFVGNRYGVYTLGTATVTATSNWWGSTTGPRCVSLCPGGGGDSVSANVTFSPYETVDPGTSVPPLAPPAFRVIAPAAQVTAGPPPAQPLAPIEDPRARWARQRAAHEAAVAARDARLHKPPSPEALDPQRRR